MRNRKWENGKYAKKKRISLKIQNFQKPLQQNFSEKVAKIHQKRLNFENKRLIFKERFFHEHNRRLAQKINKDLRTTRIHKTFHENIRILYFCFIYFREKTCNMFPTIFAFFCGTFRSQETLIPVLFWIKNLVNYKSNEPDKKNHPQKTFYELSDKIPKIIILG